MELNIVIGRKMTRHTENGSFSIDSKGTMMTETSSSQNKVKNAKTIAEYAIRKWLNEEGFALGFFVLRMNENEGVLTDCLGESITLVYDPVEKQVYVKEDQEGGSYEV